MILESLRARLSTHDPLLGAWTFLREPLAAEVASGAGYDYVCIDGQHGIHDYASIVGQLTAIAAGGRAMPIVRVPWNEPGFIGQVLDAGAGGVIVPMVNTVDQAEAVVRARRYAPLGPVADDGSAPDVSIDRDLLDYDGEQSALVLDAQVATTPRAVEILHVWDVRWSRDESRFCSGDPPEQDGPSGGPLNLQQAAGAEPTG